MDPIKDGLRAILSRQAGDSAVQLGGLLKMAGHTRQSMFTYMIVATISAELKREEHPELWETSQRFMDQVRDLYQSSGMAAQIQELYEMQGLNQQVTEALRKTPPDEQTNP